MSTPGYPAYYYGDSQTGSMSNLSEGGGGGMRRYASKSSIAGAHSLAGSRTIKDLLLQVPVFESFPVRILRKRHCGWRPLLHVHNSVVGHQRGG
ncbi:hypothetical protein ElyMa_002788700 [Elysia marginata]|uniref:Uncharacterized protein n=1 Tax=Elysia marginata TaxID=1093978 RepID=A0AAV4HP63_9GAST|nr:hypothetical protein ElyMa_002788700 [Elysia marginata]